MAEPRYGTAELAGTLVEQCLDCGSVVLGGRAAHTRFHSVLSAHAWALAVLQNAHIAAHVHERYEAYEKIKSRRFDSWSSDALAQVAQDLGDQV